MMLDDRQHVLSSDIVELLHCLGYIYLRHGQSRRAVVLLLLAAQHGPRPRIMAGLALALVEAGLGAPALQVLDQIAIRAPDWVADRAEDRLLGVIRARAMLVMGDTEQARATFAQAAAWGAAP